MAFTPKRLFIPRKTSQKQGQPDYETDMRAIEIFNPINKLVAGSGVTLTPTDGTGPQVEISASGSGGGTTFGIFAVQGTPDFSFIGNEVLNAMYFGPGAPFFGAQQVLITLFPPINPNPTQFTSATSWETPVFAGDAVNLFPFFQAPAFSAGGPLTVDVNFQAWNTGFTNFINYGGTISLTTGQSYQLQDTDVSLISSGGADLSLVAGSGTTQVGLVTAGGGVYIGSVGVTVTVPVGTVFT